MPQSLDRLVTSVATRLMAAEYANASEVCQQILAELVSYFHVDVSFLRHNDHASHASILVAEWPPRPDVPDPDPLRVIYFADADPVFAASEHGKKPLVFRPEPATGEYQQTIEKSGGVGGSSMAAAPLVSGDTTTGVVGFVKFGDRAWAPEELNALEAIGSLFAQLKARIEAEQQLRFMADHDDLTGVYNRRALVTHLEERLRPDRPGPVAVLFIDLDRLKAVNDYLGHTAGDGFIRASAARLTTRYDHRSFIARLGGDEFVVVPADPMDAGAAEALADEVRTNLHERVSIDGEMITRTASIGVATGVPGVDTSSDILRRADQSVLAAKSAGGNQVSVFTEEMSLKGALRNEIELHLQGDIESGSLLLQYLPELDLRTGEVLAAEALVRWQHPTRGLLLPDAFISVAESINLAGELGRYVLRTACEQFSQWRARGMGSTALLRVNVSPVQLVADGFAGAVADILDEFHLPGESVCLEITESVVVQDIETTRLTLSALKEVGVQIAIDDFGTGYSVLSHLKSLPVDTLKIDRSFVRELGSNTGDLAIVRAVIALAEAFDLGLVAEGVETAAAARILVDHGCFRAQGYLLSRPLSGTAMESMFRRGRITLPSSPRAHSR